MCTQAALIQSLECYMDDLVDCFEEFVKKSLLVISVALGTIILMIMYVLKVLAERAANARTICDPSDASIEYQDFQCAGITTTSKEVDTQLEGKCSDTCIDNETESTRDANRFKNNDPITSNYLLSSNTTTHSISAQVASHPSFDEKVLREIGLSSCSKPCNTSKRTLSNNDSETKPESKNKSNPAGQSCISKHHLSDPRPCSKYIAIRTSCCSMCCVDDDRR